MNYAQQYLRSAEHICAMYDGGMPLAAYLKQYFREHKKYGSKDRKHIAHLCYCYYRLGHACRELSFADRTQLALFLCQDTPGLWSVLFTEGWLAGWQKPLAERVAFATTQFPSFSVEAIFPWRDALGDSWDGTAFSRSHLVQPDLFLRLRPGYEKTVKEKLQAATIPFTVIREDCLALPNATKLEEWVHIDREAVIQDDSSQRVGELMRMAARTGVKDVWDCCAASGGKSLLACDTLGGIQLTVSDVRENIIHNLRSRFARAGVRPVNVLVADISKPVPLPKASFDLIICDAPCTGSGTWGRTPEQLYFFEENKIGAYAALQQRIAGNVLPYLKDGGCLLYITCSVFEKENESVTGELVKQGMQIVEMQHYQGYDHRADSMFACLLRK